MIRLEGRLGLRPSARGGVRDGAWARNEIRNENRGVRTDRRRRSGKKARPFVVSSAALRKQVGTSRHEHRRGLIAGLAALGVVVPDEAEIDVDLTLSSYPGGIMAVGAVTAPWVGECRRCGGPVSGTVVSSVRERFAPGGESGAGRRCLSAER